MSGDRIFTATGPPIFRASARSLGRVGGDKRLDDGNAESGKQRLRLRLGQKRALLSASTFAISARAAAPSARTSSRTAGGVSSRRSWLRL